MEGYFHRMILGARGNYVQSSLEQRHITTLWQLRSLGHELIERVAMSAHNLVQVLGPDEVTYLLAA